MTPAVCGALALAALGAGFGLVQWLYTRRLLARLDRMLAGAVDGSFRESRFDESRLSALEGRLARFLNGSAASARELEGKRAAIQTLISDISHQTKTPIANILLYASLLAEGELSPEQAAQAATLSRQADEFAMKIRRAFEAKGCPMLYDSYTNQQYPILPDKLLHELEREFAFAFWCKTDAGGGAGPGPSSGGGQGAYPGGGALRGGRPLRPEVDGGGPL